MDKIIKYKLAICRDYAKITSALLMNLFPDKTCYFVAIPSHVAAGIEFNKKIYILDQQLPIVAIDKWIMAWKLKLKKKKLKANLSKVVKNEKGIKLKKVRKILIDDVKTSSPDFGKIEKMIISSLRIKKVATRRKPDLIIPLNLYGVLYSQDGIVETSIIEAIVNVIKRELPKNYQRIANIKITKKKYDWNLRIWIKR